MRGAGIDPVEAMEPFRIELDDFLRRTQGADWPETLVTCYLTGGFLTDFFTGLAAGLPSGLSQRVSAVARHRQGSGCAGRRTAHGHRRESPAGIAARDVGAAAGGRHHAGGAVIPCDRWRAARRGAHRAGLHRADLGPHSPHGRARPDCLAAATRARPRACGAVARRPPDGCARRAG